jgi:hypothetical protein
LGVGTIILIIVIILALSFLFKAVKGIVKLLLVASIIILVILGIFSLAGELNWLEGEEITGQAVKEDNEQSMKDEAVEGTREKISDFIERKKDG